MSGRHRARRALASAVVGAALVACAGDGGGAGPTTSSERRSSDPAVPATASPVSAPPLPAVQAGAGRAIRSGFSPGYELVTAPDDVLALDLDGMAALGACWVRGDFDWSRIERVPGHFDWGSTDRLVREVSGRGMHVLALIAYTPPWARPEGTRDKHPPTDPSSFARFAAAAVARYGDRVRVWEVWNEPNIAQFWDRPDPARYTELLREASGAMRAVDPEVHILSAGLSPAVDDADSGSVAPATFMRRFLQLGGGEHVDAVAMHPYSYPEDPADEGAHENNFSVVTPRLREVLVDEGYGELLVWGTEFGAPTGTNRRAVSPAIQAVHLERAYRQWERWDWTGPLLWYAWRDRGSDTGDVEDNFGLVARDGTPKPAATAFRSRLGSLDHERCQARREE